MFSIQTHTYRSLGGDKLVVHSWYVGKHLGVLNVAEVLAIHIQISTSTENTTTIF